MSKFSEAMRAAQKRAVPEPESEPAPQSKLEQSGELDQGREAVAIEVPKEETRRSGRPAGKRSSEQITQVTAYVQKKTHIAVKRKLLDQEARTGTRQDFSGLVQELLNGWLASK